MVKYRVQWLGAFEPLPRDQQEYSIALEGADLLDLIIRVTAHVCHEAEACGPYLGDAPRRLWWGNMEVHACQD